MRTLLGIGSFWISMVARPLSVGIVVLQAGLCLEAAVASSEASDVRLCPSSQVAIESSHHSAASLLQKATQSGTANLTSATARSTNATVERHNANAHAQKASSEPKERGENSSTEDLKSSQTKSSSSFMGLLARVKDTVKDAVTSKHGVKAKDSEFFYGTIFVLTMFGLVFMVDTHYRPTE